MFIGDVNRSTIKGEERYLSGSRAFFLLCGCLLAAPLSDGGFPISIPAAFLSVIFHLNQIKRGASTLTQLPQ